MKNTIYKISGPHIDSYTNIELSSFEPSSSHLDEPSSSHVDHEEDNGLKEISIAEWINYLEHKNNVDTSTSIEDRIDSDRSMSRRWYSERWAKFICVTIGIVAFGIFVFGMAYSEVKKIETDNDKKNSPITYISPIYR